MSAIEFGLVQSAERMREVGVVFVVIQKDQPQHVPVADRCPRRDTMGVTQQRPVIQIGDFSTQFCYALLNIISKQL